MANIRSKKYKAYKKYKRSAYRKYQKASRKQVNPGYAARRDNMVYMKRLHRGQISQRYGVFGNPVPKYPMNMQGITSYVRDSMKGKKQRVPKRRYRDRKHDEL